MDPKFPKTDSPLPTDENPLQSEDVMPRRRRTKLMESEAKRNITIAIIGIVIVLGLFIMFGVTALQKLSDLTIKEKDAADVKKPIIEVISPPTLDTTFTATNSAEVTISGQSDDGDSVKLYVNNALADKEKLKSDHSFSFESVTLKEGVNTIRAKVVSGKNESNFSDPLKISYYNSAPTIEIVSPADGRSFNHDQNPIKVSGKTDNNANVMVNDHRVIMETDGNFEYSLFLHDGDNDIKIVAVDEAGNQTEKHIKAILQ